MKNLMIFCLFIFASNSILFGQDKPETEYLVDLKKVKVSGFGNTYSELSIVDGNPAYSSGGAGAFLFNYKTFVGFYNHDLVTLHSREDIYPSDHNPTTNPLSPSFIHNTIRFNHGGLWVGYLNNPNKLFHWGANIKLGGGSIALYDRDIDFRDINDHHRDWIGVVNPEVNIEMNITRWFKMSAGVGYRLVWGVDNDSYINYAGESKRFFNANQFSSPMASIKFMFGSFGPRTNGKKKTDNIIE